VRDFRIAVGNSLKGKIGEHGFFLQQIADITKIIEQKHAIQDYPLNGELDRLNYFFSAYLNTIQSLKDSCQTAMEVDFSWSVLSPTYGDFIFYCRNAATHDGYHLINAGKGIKNYITGPLRRIDSRGKVIEFAPPKEDVLTLCWNLSAEALASVGELLKRDGGKIPVAEEADFRKANEASLTSDFIPDEIKKIIQANKESIDASFKGLKIDVVSPTLSAITLLETLITDARST
jgi:hypothetical protein